MEIKNVMLVTEGEDPTAAEPVFASCEAEGSCLLITIAKGEQKANCFLWRDNDGRVWGRITTAKEEQKGELGREIDLFEVAETQQQEPVDLPVKEDTAQPQEPENLPVVQEQPEIDEEPPIESEVQITPVHEDIPEGIEIPF